jgi:hypothetical protein
MDLRNMKLDLAVALLNNPQCSNAPKVAKDHLQSFQEVGRFLGTEVTRRKQMGAKRIERMYSIQFENCTLNLQLVSNLEDYSHLVNGFELNRRTA